MSNFLSYHIFKIFLPALLGFIFLCSYSTALAVQNVPDSKGKDFWFAFPPNYHNNFYDDTGLQFEDTIYVYITSEKPANGVIEYYSRFDSILHQVPFTITDVNEIITFGIPSFYTELRGWNLSGDIAAPRNESETISKMAFHVTSTEEVTVYALNQAEMTSDAMLVLPVDVLDIDYFIMAYKSDGYKDYQDSLIPNCTPSQFAIVATQDSTEVTIIPSTPTVYNGLDTQFVTMNKGEAYLVQALITPYNLNPDLTGSEVLSTKPVAVFGSHQRTSLPIEIETLNSRDYLLEQIPPLNTWGKSSFLIPYPKSRNEVKEGNNLYRILAAKDSTEIYLNGTLIDILDKGQYHEDSLVSPGIIKASAPILVAQFKKTSNIGSTYFSGDPFMMLIPPKEQFMNSYRVINAQAWETNLSGFVGPIYDEQYITVVAFDTARNNVVLDGVPINSGWLLIPGSGYSYNNAKVTDGVHTLSCNSPFGVYVYGYGPANSYGYVGGMSFVPLLAPPPEIAFKDSCYSVRVMAYDTSEQHSGIIDAFSSVDSWDNVRVISYPYNPPADTVYYYAELIDKSMDGSFQVVARDSLGGKNTKTINIAGFTLSIDKNELIDTIVVYSKNGRKNKQYCYNLVIHNYGKHLQQINNYTFSNSNFPLISNFKSVLLPGDKDSIIVCASFNNNGIYLDSLLLTTPCDTKYIAKLIFKLEQDGNPPDYTISSDSCSSIRNVIITDSLSSDSGIESLSVLISDNCSVSGTIDPSGKIAHSQTTISDPTWDAIYSIAAMDSTGVTTIITDTIAGFTISTLDFSSPLGIYDVGEHNVGELFCDYMKLYNYGFFPITINDINLKDGTVFSIPLSQFPIMVLPKDSAKLKICFNPNSYSETGFHDTINFSFNCFEFPLNIIGEGILDTVYQSISHCNVTVIFKERKIIPTSYLMQSYPNPASESAIINFGLASSSALRLDVYDIMGNFVENIATGEFRAGDFEVQLGLENLPQGKYLIKLQTVNEIITNSMIIEK